LVDSGKVEAHRSNLVAPQYLRFQFWSSGFLKKDFVEFGVKCKIFCLRFIIYSRIELHVHYLFQVVVHAILFDIFSIN
jgi:hypothetical protein